MPQELSDLIAETKKQLEHLRALGVEGIRGTQATAPTPAPAIEVSKPLPKASRAEPVIEPVPAATVIITIRRPSTGSRKTNPLN